MYAKKQFNIHNKVLMTFYNLAENKGTYYLKNRPESL